MVNSGSYKDRNEKAELTQLPANGVCDDLSSPVMAPVLAQCKADSKQTADVVLPSASAAIEPKMSTDALLQHHSDPVDEVSIVKNEGEDHDDQGNTVCCSVPLDKVHGVLNTQNSVITKADTDAESKMKQIPSRKLLCLYCDRTFVSANLRQKHVERCHSAKQTRRVSPRQLLTATPCVHCDKLNNSEHTLKDLFLHLTNEHSNKYYACTPCEERFLSPSQLTEHNASKHPKSVTTPLETPTCSKLIPKSEESPKEEEEEEEEEEIPKKLTRSRLKIQSDNKKPSIDKGKRIVAGSKKNTKFKDLRNKKFAVKTSRIALKRSKRLQAKLPPENTKLRRSKVTERKINKVIETTTSTKTVEKPNKPNSSCVNPYPEFDCFFRVKKITDHSIDNLKISSLTFDDVFDKAFFNRIKCNIQENLLHHIDGKLFKNEESDARISNFEKTSHLQQEVQNSSSENYGCDLSLNAATPVAALSLNSHFGEDFESQIEYGSKPSKKKNQTKTKDEVHYKYFTRRKYQASILEHKENRDLSKLDMWTQLVIKNRQQKIVDNKKTAKEILEYTNGDEYKSKLRKEELNRILDRRGPFEDLREEANKKAALDKLNSGSSESISQETFSEVREVLDEVLNKVYSMCDGIIPKEENDIISSSSKDSDVREIPSYLNLRLASTLPIEGDVDRSDKIALICSSQETDNFELPTNSVRDKNELVELTGEWARTRMYICAACGKKFPNLKYLLEHKSFYHQNVWVQHYEMVGNQSELYRHLSIPSLGKVGLIEDSVQCKVWKRSDARVCSKCGKQCNALAELHRHILECGGDWTWMLARKKCKYRPFRSKRGRKRRGLIKRNDLPNKTDQPIQKKIYKKTFDGPRPRPSDADTIQRMLANLPAKRSTRKIMSLQDGFRPRKTKECAKTKQSKLKCGKLIFKNVKNNDAKSISSPKSLRSTKRNFNAVLSSRLLDTNRTLRAKRILKNLANRRITRQNKAIVETIGMTEDEKPTEIVDEVSPKRKKNNKNKENLEANNEIVDSTTKMLPKKDKSVSPQVKKKLTMKKILTGKINIKSFFPVKKKKKIGNVENDNNEVVGRVTRRSKEIKQDAETNSESIRIETAKLAAEPDIIKKTSKKGLVGNLVKTFSMRRKKKEASNIETIIENVKTDLGNNVKEPNQVEYIQVSEEDLSKKKRKLKRSFRNVVNKVKKVKVDNKPQIVQTETSPNDDRLTQLNKPNSFLEEPCPMGTSLEKIVAPSILERNENIVDNTTIVPTAISCIENLLVPETMFNLETNNEKSLQAKCELNFDSKSSVDLKITANTICDIISEDQTVVESENNETKTKEIPEEHLRKDTIVTEPFQIASSLCDKTGPISIETSSKCSNSPLSSPLTSLVSPLSGSLISPSLSKKTRKPGKGLNDCIAMLTSKLQQKSEESTCDALRKSNSESNIETLNNIEKKTELKIAEKPIVPKLFEKPTVQKPECILKIPTFKSQITEPVEQALDLTTKSSESLNSPINHEIKINDTINMPTNFQSKSCENLTPHLNFANAFYPYSNLIGLHPNFLFGNLSTDPFEVHRLRALSNLDLVIESVVEKSRASSNIDNIIQQVVENSCAASKSMPNLNKTLEGKYASKNSVNEIIEYVIRTYEGDDSGKDKVGIKVKDRKIGAVRKKNQKNEKLDSNNKNERSNEELNTAFIEEEATVIPCRRKDSNRKIGEPRKRISKRITQAVQNDVKNNEKPYLETNVDDLLSTKEITVNPEVSSSIVIVKDVVIESTDKSNCNSTIELTELINEDEPHLLENKIVIQSKVDIPVDSDSDDDIPLATLLNTDHKELKNLLLEQTNAAIDKSTQTIPKNSKFANITATENLNLIEKNRDRKHTNKIELKAKSTNQNESVTNEKEIEEKVIRKEDTPKEIKVQKRRGRKPRVKPNEMKLEDVSSKDLKEPNTSYKKEDIYNQVEEIINTEDTENNKPSDKGTVIAELPNTVSSEKLNESKLRGVQKEKYDSDLSNSVETVKTEKCVTKKGRRGRKSKTINLLTDTTKDNKVDFKPNEFSEVIDTIVDSNENHDRLVTKQDINDTKNEDSKFKIQEPECSPVDCGRSIFKEELESKQINKNDSNLISDIQEGLTTDPNLHPEVSPFSIIIPDNQSRHSCEKIEIIQSNEQVLFKNVNLESACIKIVEDSCSSNNDQEDLKLRNNTHQSNAETKSSDLEARENIEVSKNIEINIERKVEAPIKIQIKRQGKNRTRLSSIILTDNVDTTAASDVLGTDLENLGETNELHASEQKRKGRKKKNINPAQSVDKDTEILTIKETLISEPKKRGRKKKSVTDEVNDADNPDNPSTDFTADTYIIDIKKRGRKKRSLPDVVVDTIHDGPDISLENDCSTKELCPVEISNSNREVEILNVAPKTQSTDTCEPATKKQIEQFENHNVDETKQLHLETVTQSEDNDVLRTETEDFDIPQILEEVEKKPHEPKLITKITRKKSSGKCEEYVADSIIKESRAQEDIHEVFPESLVNDQNNLHLYLTKDSPKKRRSFKSKSPNEFNNADITPNEEKTPDNKLITKTITETCVSPKRPENEIVTTSFTESSLDSKNIEPGISTFNDVDAVINDTLTNQKEKIVDYIDDRNKESITEIIPKIVVKKRRGKKKKTPNNSLYIENILNYNLTNSEDNLSESSVSELKLNEVEEEKLNNLVHDISVQNAITKEGELMLDKKHLNQDDLDNSNIEINITSRKTTGSRTKSDSLANSTGENKAINIQETNTDFKHVKNIKSMAKEDEKREVKEVIPKLIVKKRKRLSSPSSSDASDFDKIENYFVETFSEKSTTDTVLSDEHKKYQTKKKRGSRSKSLTVTNINNDLKTVEGDVTEPLEIRSKRKSRSQHKSSDIDDFDEITFSSSVDINTTTANQESIYDFESSTSSIEILNKDKSTPKNLVDNVITEEFTLIDPTNSDSTLRGKASEENLVSLNENDPEKESLKEVSLNELEHICETDTLGNNLDIGDIKSIFKESSTNPHEVQSIEDITCNQRRRKGQRNKIIEKDDILNTEEYKNRNASLPNLESDATENQNIESEVNKPINNKKKSKVMCRSRKRRTLNSQLSLESMDSNEIKHNISNETYTQIKDDKVKLSETVVTINLKESINEKIDGFFANFNNYESERINKVTKNLVNSTNEDQPVNLLNHSIILSKSISPCKENYKDLNIAEELNLNDKIYDFEDNEVFTDSLNHNNRFGGSKSDIKDINLEEEKNNSTLLDPVLQISENTTRLSRSSKLRASSKINSIADLENNLLDAMDEEFDIQNSADGIIKDNEDKNFSLETANVDLINEIVNTSSDDNKTSYKKRGRKSRRDINVGVLEHYPPVVDKNLVNEENESTTNKILTSYTTNVISGDSLKVDSTLHSATADPKITNTVKRRGRKKKLETPITNTVELLAPIEKLLVTEKPLNNGTESMEYGIINCAVSFNREVNNICQEINEDVENLESGKIDVEYKSINDYTSATNIVNPAEDECVVFQEKNISELSTTKTDNAIKRRGRRKKSDPFSINVSDMQMPTAISNDADFTTIMQDHSEVENYSTQIDKTNSDVIIEEIATDSNIKMNNAIISSNTPSDLSIDDTKITVIANVCPEIKTASIELNDFVLENPEKNQTKMLNDSTNTDVTVKRRGRKKRSEVAQLTAAATILPALNLSSEDLEVSLEATRKSRASKTKAAEKITKVSVEENIDEVTFIDSEIGENVEENKLAKETTRRPSLAHSVEDILKDDKNAHVSKESSSDIEILDIDSGPECSQKTTSKPIDYIETIDDDDDDVTIINDSVDSTVNSKKFKPHSEILEELAAIMPDSKEISLEQPRLDPGGESKDNEIKSDKSEVAAESRRKPRRKSKTSKKIVNKHLENDIFQDFTLVIKSKRKPRPDFLLNIQEVIDYNGLTDGNSTNKLPEPNHSESENVDDDNDVNLGESFDMVDMELDDEIPVNNTIIEREIPIEQVSAINSQMITEDQSQLKEQESSSKDYEKEKANIVAEAIRRSNMALILNKEPSPQSVAQYNSLDLTDFLTNEREDSINELKESFMEKNKSLMREKDDNDSEVDLILDENTTQPILSEKPKFDFNKYYLEKMKLQQQKSYQVEVEESEPESNSSSRLGFKEESDLSLTSQNETFSQLKRDKKKQIKIMSPTENKDADVYTFDEFDELIETPLKNTSKLGNELIVDKDDTALFKTVDGIKNIDSMNSVNFGLLDKEGAINNNSELDLNNVTGSIKAIPTKRPKPDRKPSSSISTVIEADGVKHKRKNKSKLRDIFDQIPVLETTEEDVLDGDVRRSRRCSRKITTYNENELDPILDELVSDNKIPLKKDKSADNKLIDITENITLEPTEINVLTSTNATDKRKLNSDELFDMLKASGAENISKSHPEFLEQHDDTSEEFTDDKFDNIFENMIEKSMAAIQNQECTNKEVNLDKIYEFSESSDDITKSENTKHCIKLNTNNFNINEDDINSDQNSNSKPLTPDIKDCKKRNSRIQKLRETSSEYSLPTTPGIKDLNLDTRKQKVKDNRVEDQLANPNYCDICKKSFIRIENLVKHKRTLTHISKLSELEAKEAEEKAKAEQKDETLKSEAEAVSSEAGMNISVILSSETSKPDTPVPSTFSPNNHTLKLAEILDDVITEPILEKVSESFNNVNVRNSPDLQTDYRPYKSLAERKSFEGGNPVNSPDCPTILAKQISLLQNIIENQTGMSYIDDISMSSNASAIDNGSIQPSSSEISLKDDSSNVTFTNNPITKDIYKPDTDKESFLKPTQYEEISEDSTNVRTYDDPKLRKTLNRDEELFLECCSLLKSGSEVSNYSKKSNKTSDILNRTDANKTEEPSWTEDKSLSRVEKFDVEYSDNSRVSTPLGDNMLDDASDSNTISSNWNVNVDEKDDPLQDKEEHEKSFTFEEVLHNSGSMDKEKTKSTLSRFGGMLSKTIKSRINNIASKIRKPAEERRDSSERKKSDDLSDCSTSDSKKIMTKGAMKVFEGLKVSIPTEELNLEEVLNCSPQAKKSSDSAGEEKEANVLEEPSSPSKRNARKSKPVKNKSQTGSKLLFKINKKKPIDKRKKNANIDEMHDVYDFEDTQDNSETFPKPDFRTFKHKKDDTAAKESDNESNDNPDVIEANSASSVSSVSNSNQQLKKPKAQQNMTKKKCMIMGRIFKNAVKSKLDGEIRDIPSIDNAEFVENYVKEVEQVKLSGNIADPMDNCESGEKNPPEISKIKNVEARRKSVKQRNKKRARGNSESTDDEFSLNKTSKKRSYKKNSKPEDNCINLEQELKECIGVASRKSQRKCTSGKQNVLVEYWSSDDSAFEALLESQIVEAKPEKDLSTPKDPEPVPVRPIVKENGEMTSEVPSTVASDKKIQKKQRPKSNKSESQTAASNRRKRAAANPLYHWSSSSEDESNDLIEVKPIRDEVDDDEERPIQHGWIVGDSPKKLVTLLAHAKGKKTDIDCVKEQKKRTNSVS